MKIIINKEDYLRIVSALNDKVAILSDEGAGYDQLRLIYDTQGKLRNQFLKERKRQWKRRKDVSGRG